MTFTWIELIDSHVLLIIPSGARVMRSTNYSIMPFVLRRHPMVIRASSLHLYITPPHLHIAYSTSHKNNT